MIDVVESNSAAAVPTSAAFANQPAWHGMGTVFDTGKAKGMTVEQALPAAGLDFTVEKVEIAGLASGRKIANRWGIQRSDNEEILGVVGKDWHPLQNVEGLGVLDDVIRLAADNSDAKMEIESAFALDGGRKVCILVHVEEDWQIAGEDYASYLLFSNGHDGRMAVTVASVKMRVVCANTLNYAVYVEGKESGRLVRVRHTKTAADRLKAASRVLGMRDRHAEALARQGEWLVEQEMGDGEFEQFVESLMPLDPEQEEKPAGTMIRDRRGVLQGLYHHASNLDPIRGTRWGALQASIEFADHHRAFKSGETKASAQLGLSRSEFKDRAYGLLVPA